MAYMLQPPLLTQCQPPQRSSVYLDGRRIKVLYSPSQRRYNKQQHQLETIHIPSSTDKSHRLERLVHDHSMSPACKTVHVGVARIPHRDRSSFQGEALLCYGPDRRHPCGLCSLRQRSIGLCLATNAVDRLRSVQLRERTMKNIRRLPPWPSLQEPRDQQQGDQAWQGSLACHEYGKRLNQFCVMVSKLVRLARLVPQIQRTTHSITSL